MIYCNITEIIVLKNTVNIVRGVFTAQLMAIICGVTYRWLKFKCDK